MAEWPFTPNGKIDRQQLPAPDFTATEEYAAPRTPVEEQLAAIWQAVLGVDRVGVTSNFFSLGGHSLLATQVVARIGQALGIELPLRTLFEEPTIAALASRIAAMQPQRKRPPLLPGPRTARIPLSFAQQRLWLISQIDPMSSAYNIPGALRLTGDLNGAALTAALETLITRHEVLRTVFGTHDGEPEQQILPPAPLALTTIDLRDRPSADREATAAEIAFTAMQTPFDLTTGPLLRATLFRLADDDAILLVLMHHIITDGWSVPILLAEVAQLYAAHCNGEIPVLPELPIQYADYAHWQRSWLTGERLAEQVAYWTAHLSGAPTLLQLPTDRPRAATPSYRADSLSFVIEADVVTALNGLAQTQGATLYMAVLSAFAVLLSRYSGQSDLVIGSPIANRTHPALDGLIGFFVNTLALRIDLAAQPSFVELLARVRETTLAAYAHQDAPFEGVIEALQLPRSLSHAPLFQVLLAWQSATTTAAPITLPGLALTPVDWQKPTLDYDLALSIAEDNGALAVNWQYSVDLFDGATMARMIADWQTLLAAIVADPGQSIATVPLLAASTQAALLAAGTGAPEPTLGEHSLHQLFEAQVERDPLAPAIFYADAVLRYGDLNARANQLAHRLLAAGHSHGERIAICLDRSPELMVAVLAVLKCGAAYVPLDPDYPAERLRFLIEDAQVTLLITTAALAGVLPAEAAEMLLLDTLDLTALPPTNPSIMVTPTDPFYQIYTSGSTGLPKGVLVPHRGIANTIQATARAIDLQPGDRFLQFVPVGFDAAAIDFFAPLSCGAAIVIHPAPTRLADHELLAICSQYRVTVSNFSTARWQQLVANMALQGLRFPAALRIFLTGGEKPSAQILQTWATLADHEMLFVSSYGPSEASISTSMFVTTSHAVQQAPPTTIHLGRPLPNVAFYLLDAAQQMVPPGAPGELYIGGIGVTPGYWQRPELTAERFIELPAFAGDGTPLRLYRTGDLARWLSAAGEPPICEFVGRVDGQVKIRGFRMELGEIEGQLNALPGVRMAVAVARATEGGDKQLVAYVQPVDGTVTQAALAAALKARLPAHMVPAAWVLLDRWPLTPNGKIDRSALPVPSTIDAAGDYVAPRTEVEATLVAIWQEVLAVSPIGVTTNFFDLGGHSLNATQVVARIGQQLGHTIPLRTLFEQPTIAELAVALQQAAHAVQRLPLVRVDRTAPLPLSFAQQRLWLLQQLHPASSFFNMPAALWLAGPLDGAALQAAFDAMVARHESLRTTFPLVNGAPVQQIAEPTTLPIAHHPAMGDAAAWDEAAITAWVVAEAERPFDLQAGPLVRVALLHVAPDRHLLLVNLHHIIGDDWSRRIFMAEFSALYRAAVQGETAPLPPLTIQYADFAQWQRGWLQGPLLQQQLAYWQTQLADAPPLLELPTDRPRPPQQRFVGDRFTVTLDESLAVALRDFSRAQGATLHMTLLTGFATLLARYSGMADLVIGIPVAGRTDPQIEGLLGFFLNTLALRIRLHDEPTFSDLLAHVKAVTLEAYANQDAPFEQVIEVVNPTPQLSHTPIFQVMFDLAQADRDELELPGLTVRPVDFATSSAKFDINLIANETVAGAAALQLTWEYNSDIFARATIEQMARHLQQLLTAALAHPATPVLRLPLLTATEERQLIQTWNQTARTVPVDRCMQELFEAQVARTPDIVAARHRDTAITYRALNARANRWAHQLIERGVTADVIVTPFWSRDLDFLTAILAIFKAGGAYLPLDPQTPAPRIAQILAQSRTPLLLTNREFLPRVEAALAELPQEQRPRLCLIEEFETASAPATNPPRRNRPESLAYVIFTSGSTGVPKGVMVEQRGLVNHLCAMQQNLALSAADLIGQTATQSYVISVWQFLAALTFGGTIRIVPDETLLDPAALIDTIDAQKITVVQVVPSLLRLMIEALQQRRSVADYTITGMALRGGDNGNGVHSPTTPTGRLLPRLRWLIPTGEALPPALARSWFALCPHIPLLNAYGSSECSDDVAHDLITAPPAEHVVTMPIGQPIANVQMVVLDGDQQPVPFGVAGELYVGGLGVGRGYLHDPERTAAVFGPNPYATTPPGRFYKTGDRVRRLADGTVEYLGRVDFQVKIRGIRVELGEIEATLGKHPAVAQAVVITNADHAGQPRVLAYVVLNDPTVATSALRQFLAERLPDYMVPTLILPLPALPLNASGKVARQLLPSPTHLLEGDRAAYVAPRNAVEAAVVEILATVMGLDQAALGVHHHFFDLGGHSMQAIQIVWQLRERFGVDLPLRSIFEQSTVESLANLIIDAQLAQLDDATLAALLDAVEAA
jgi:amino acid adenylation domain-containing protein